MDGFPAVLLAGPRQSGKTTLLQHEFGVGANYASLDDPLTRDFAITDPNGFLDRFTEERVILDEIQHAPDLLTYLKPRIDRERSRYGRWLLTGSQQFQLMSHVTESLAGRIATLDLLPFSLAELRGARDVALTDALWNGGYPDPALAPQQRDLWLRSYIQTYLERDVRQLRNILDLRSFETLLALAASRHAQELHPASLSRETGVTQPTTKSWIGLLEATYVVATVRPFLRNLGKRLIKAPKLYFVDPALVCALTRQPSAEAAISGSQGGALFEGLIALEIIKHAAAQGRHADVFHWRSHDGLEIDLLLRRDGRVLPIEVKLTSTPTMHHAQPLLRFRELVGAAEAAPGIIVCRVQEPIDMPHGIVALPWQAFPDWLRRAG